MTSSTVVNAAQTNTVGRIAAAPLVTQAVDEALDEWGASDGC